jgi:organic radical activating enzyme
LRVRSKTSISQDQLKKIFDDFKNLGGKSVRLTGGGEPLSHPNVIPIIEYLASQDFKITVETNGDLITDSIASVIAKHVNHLRISVDAANNSSRKQIHQPSCSKFTYDQLLNKIAKVRNRSADYGRSQELFLGATFIVLPENYSLINKFVSDMYKLDVNWVAIRKNIYREVYSNTPEIVASIENDIKILQDAFNKSTRNFTIESQYGVSFKPQDDLDECLVSYARYVILADSSLQLCCLARNGIIPEAYIGALSNDLTPIRNLLDDNKFLIDKFHKAVPKSCQYCIDKDNNISFSQVVALLKKDQNYKFSKANVFVGNNQFYVDSNCITQIAIDHTKFEEFKNGSIVAINK